MPQNELAAELYEATTNIMEEQQLLPYEVSNYAKTGHECLHNLTYWRYQDYIGIGPGAHGRYTKDGQKIATTMIHSPNQWLKVVNENGHGLQKISLLTPKECTQEKILMGLRLNEGIDKTLIANDHKLTNLINEGLIEINNDKVRTTRKGQLILDHIILELT